ncbi:MAG: class I SAM-dependent methyltransferase [Desulfatiglandales bacterium]
MKKFKGYHIYLQDIKSSGIKPLFHGLSKKNTFFKKLYLRLTNISVKRLHLIPNIKSANNILNIGCGTGEVAEYVRNFLNFHTKLLGVDMERNPELRDFIHFYQCDIDENDLPFEDGEFDVVISNFSIEHLRYPQRLFLEVHRVLRAGGYFYAPLSTLPHCSAPIIGSSIQTQPT